MTQTLSEKQLLDALQTCADEPVHRPGTIQPFAYLFVCSMTDGAICEASANCADLFDRSIEVLLGEDARTLLGREIWHNLVNVRAGADFKGKRHFAGVWSTGGQNYAIHCSGSGDNFVVEIEEEPASQRNVRDLLRDQAFLIGQIERCETLDDLFGLSTRLLRHITGFDRVKVIQFDETWNGMVVAESRSSLIDTMLGLRFPASDIPSQARALMAELPMRLIADVRQAPVPIVLNDPARLPTDITYAACRGISPVHVQYLQNMGISATMTLSLRLGDELWGYISFHNKTPYFASPDLRHILLEFLRVLRLKVSLIRRNAALTVAKEVDELQNKVQLEMEGSSDLGALLDGVGPAICKVLDASGVIMTTGSQDFSFGEVPETSVVQGLHDRGKSMTGKWFATDCLSEALPGINGRLNGFAGAIVTAHADDRSLQVFRKEIRQSVSWAGNPEKEIEIRDGSPQLNPRSSFSAYLEETEGRAKDWSRDDIHTMRQLWPLLAAAERRAFMADLNRQQTLMINELNHRVRNILALVKSVSSQARRSGGSLESYSEALEARIHALAAAHDIGAGAARSSVAMGQIFRLEAEPYDANGESRVRVSGVDANIRAEAAPIFALVIHELMTNAVKYGALSVSSGAVDVAVEEIPDAVRISWKETDGPKVTEPERLGFGTTLIQQAVPYEMGGKAELLFAESGVKAVLEVPISALELDSSPAPLAKTVRQATEEEEVVRLRNGLVLLLEDNFMIAEDMRTELEAAGFLNVETVPNAERALAFLDETTPTLALLDVNLGHGQTSEEVASTLLLKGVPVIFVTGYGEQHSLSAQLRQVPVLTKPVQIKDLMETVQSMVA